MPVWVPLTSFRVTVYGRKPRNGEVSTRDRRPREIKEDPARPCDVNGNEGYVNLRGRITTDPDLIADWDGVWGTVVENGLGEATTKT